MPSRAKTVDEYLAELPEERRAAVQAVRAAIRKRLPKGYEEGMQYGMIGWYVPHRLYPAGYHCDPRQPLPFAGLAAQKNHLSLHLMCVYSDPALERWFVDAWRASGKKLDMGKGCVRFRKLEDVPLDVVGEAVARVPVKDYLAQYEAARGDRGRKASPAAAKKPAAKKPAAKKATAKKSSTKLATKKKPAAR